MRLDRRTAADRDWNVRPRATNPVLAVEEQPVGRPCRSACPSTARAAASNLATSQGRAQGRRAW